MWFSKALQFLYYESGPIPVGNNTPEIDLIGCSGHKRWKGMKKIYFSGFSRMCNSPNDKSKTKIFKNSLFWITNRFFYSCEQNIKINLILIFGNTVFLEVTYT